MPGPMRMKMPCSWRNGGLHDFSGRVLFRRRFGYPGRIDDYERVWLTFERIDGTSRIRLNDQQVGQGDTGSFEFEVTSLLQPRNQLEVIVEALGDGGLVGEVAMEIRCTAFLKNVHVFEFSAPQRWRIHGELIGSCERPLELYAVTDQGTIAYRTIDTRQGGQPFEFHIDDPPGGVENVRVELINVSTVWYAVEVNVERTNSAT